MGILNVTPDSFSDGGEYLDLDAAVAHGLALHAEGADIVDVGGESTRPGALRADPRTERDRVVPVVEQLTAAGVPVSVDTMRADVAMAAVAAGAGLVNDVSGGLADPDMLAAVAGADVDYVAMHWRGHSDRMVGLASYADVVAEVCSELSDRLDAALAAGIAKDRIILDPGLGFAKTAAHNWELLRRLDTLATLGRPLLVGASRKRFLGELLADEDGPRPVREREDAGVAITALVAAQHVWGVRTHTARPHRDAIAAAHRLAARDGRDAG
ncbi:MAG: dihydropteroate synthase [Propionicimonas sp.]|uniref:dihydropteroate synthase n=1 Tax=Propionicimonas sp. TaxID=1955623 RepID=UPI003D11EEE4